MSSALLAGLRFETRMMRRDGAIWFTLTALAGIVLFALAMGASRVAAQQAAITAARADEAQRIATLQKTLTQLQEADAHGKPTPEPPPFRDPRNPIFMGGGPAAAVAALAPAPLALVATGQSDLLPPAIRVTTGSKDGFLFADEIDNPANLMSGATDLAFVVVFVYPLVILAMAFNLLAGEREHGTLAMTLASARRPGAVFAGKLMARVAAPIVTMLLGVAAGVWIFAGWERLVSPEFAALLAAILLYGLFWAALAAAVDGLGRGSAFNALTLVGAWVAITMILPAAINSLAAFAHPAPSRIDMTLAARAASTDADRARDASLARYAQEHGEAGRPRGGPQEMTLRRLATQEAAFQRVEAIIAEHDAQRARQRDMADRLGYLSPAYLTYQAMADIAGAGEARYRAFLDRIRAFHVDWREFFLSRAKAGASLSAQDYAAMPKFTQADEELMARAPAGHFGPLIGVALPALLLAALGFIGFRRAAPR
ncbi:MAG: ABC transporter permease [Methylocystis sp.]|uniref:ABC transporter permease n=1 Tax=Methylocystis sp. TaxID=1911079 RepID=UPI003D1425D5